MNIYLDIDGVLLKKDGTLAGHFDEFIEFFVNNHDVYWLTTHCHGGENRAIEHISQNNKISEKTLALLEKIKPTDWYSLKTEAIDFSQEFVWFDDYVMSAERKVLLENDAYMRLHMIDLKRDPDYLNGMTSIDYGRGEPTNWRKMDLEISFTPEEFELIKKGFVSDKGMDERWRFLFEDDSLYILRHWVANVIYKMKFRFSKGKYITEEVYSVFVDDPGMSEEEKRVKNNYHSVFIIWLIESYLLGNRRDYLFNHYFQFKLEIAADSIHGYNHWKNVEKFGNYIADKNGADKKVISNFAFLHDIGRTAEYKEPGHGQKSAEIIKKFFSAGSLELNNQQYEKLLEAVAEHENSAAKSDDMTIQTCWDADRLDLPRVYIFPDKNLLYTAVGKSEETFDYFKIGE